MTEPFEEGSMVRIDRPTADLYDAQRIYPEGFTFEVEEFERDNGEHAGDPEYIQGDFYMGNANGGYNNVSVPADAVSLVMSAEEMNERRGPTLQQLTDYLSDHLTSVEEFNVNQSNADYQQGIVEFLGKMDNGLEFAFSVKIIDHGVIDA